LGCMGHWSIRRRRGRRSKRSLPFFTYIRVIACYLFSPILTSDNREYYNIRSKYFSCKLL
jgi:hypothetical protein